MENKGSFNDSSKGKYSVCWPYQKVLLQIKRSMRAYWGGHTQGHELEDGPETVQIASKSDK